MTKQEILKLLENRVSDSQAVQQAMSDVRSIEIQLERGDLSSSERNRLNGELAAIKQPLRMAISENVILPIRAILMDEFVDVCLQAEQCVTGFERAWSEFAPQFEMTQFPGLECRLTVLAGAVKP